MIEYPAKPRISAPQIATTIAAEGSAGAELAELTAYNFRLCAHRMVLFTSSWGLVEEIRRDLAPSHMAQYGDGEAQGQHRFRIRRSHWPRQGQAARKHP
jgi:hypothetical protein